MTVVATGNGMLTLGIMGVCMGWELSICIGNTHRPGGSLGLGLGLGLGSTARIRDRRGSLIEAGLPGLLGCGLGRRAITISNRSIRRRISSL